jgi:hypothetical protein
MMPPPADTTKGGDRHVYRRVMTPLPLLLRADLPEGQERRLDPPLLEPIVVQRNFSFTRR